jgi:hypothetical protein
MRERTGLPLRIFFFYRAYFFCLHEFLGGRTIGPVFGTAAAEFESLCSRSVDARLNMPCPSKNKKLKSA